MNLQGGSCMRLKIFIGKEHPEEVHIYTHEKTKLIEEIEQVIENNSLSLVGYLDEESVKINLPDVHCFTVEENKVYALTENERLRLKQRLYQLEEKLPDNFVKINQSCIVNINKIDRFKADISTSLSVMLKNGYKDYVSRRQLKIVKERLGF